MGNWRVVEFGEIPKSWDVTTIDECTEIVTDYVANGSFASLRENVNYLDADGFAWLVRLRDYHNSFGNDRVWIDEHAYHFLKKSKLFGGEVIVSNVGQPGVVFRAPSRDEFPMSLGPNSIMIRFLESDIFYFYWLKSPFGQYMIDGIIGGSAQQKFNKTSFKRIACPRPPLAEQEAIAEVLSSLDDKIDLLKRQNKTLEGMAEALFRQWFIEEAQDDWEYSGLGNFVDIANGLSYKSSDLMASSTAMISLKCFRREGGFSREGLKEFEGGYKKRHIARKGDLFIACTDLTQDAEVVGNPIVLNDNYGYSTLVFSMDTVKVIPTGVLGAQFLYHLMRIRLFKEHCKAHANGSTVLHLQKSAISEFEFFVPPRQKSDEFESKCYYFNKRKVLNECQIESLQRQRDTLLPKLMSGEVRVNLD